MRSLTRASVLVALACFAVPFTSSTAIAGGTAGFDQAVYTVTPGQTFQAQVHFDSNDSLAGYQALSSGLWTFGLKVSYPGSKAEVGSVADIILPLALQDNGAGDAALKAVVAGEAKVFGGVNLFTASDGYKDSLLVTFDITNLAPLGDSYQLTLGRYSASPTFANFTDFGTGESIDSQLAFGSATVNVVPEPLTLTLLGLGGMAVLRRRIRGA